MQPHKPLLCLMLRTELERWDIGLHLPPRKHLSEVIRAVQLEQIPFQPVHNPERFVVSWQLGWKPKSTTTLKLITQSSFSLLALLCGKAMHDVLVFRRSSFFFFCFFLQLLLRNGFQTQALTVFSQLHNGVQQCNHGCCSAGTAAPAEEPTSLRGLTPCGLTPALHTVTLLSFHLLNELGS